MIPNFIGGEWVFPDTAESLDVTDPATGEALGRVPFSEAAHVDAAVRAAADAFPAWRATPAVDRARVLFRLVALMYEHKNELALSLSREHGKNVAEAAGELQRGIENIEHACAIPTLMMGETLEDVAPGIDCETVLQPLGVFAVVTPYNFPTMIPLWFWPYAVASGNTVVLKPSEQDPLTHQTIVDLAVKAGLPPGALNVVHGGPDVVATLCDHEQVEGVSFVGSSLIASRIYARAAKSGKRVQALGGAKNHLIVMPDADMDAVTTAVIASVYGCTGQRCLAGSVVVGVGEAHAQLRDRLIDAAASLNLGRGTEEGTDLGPVISAAHRQRILEFIETGIAEGATLTLDGRDASVPGYPDGHWVGPTVFENVRPDMTVGSEEIFGPVMGINRVDSLDEAIDQLELNRYGNATSIFTTSGRAAREFRYRAGISMIGVNVGVAGPMAFFPFGGSKGSFFGDLKAQGRDAIEFYTDRRVVISRW
jgi:malonate-semialdehyde dehydrogenase (acetylating)/methylmalonate-semialdehyde dehydrogenase